MNRNKCTQTYTCYSDLEDNEALPFVKTWLNMEDGILTETK